MNKENRMGPKRTQFGKMNLPRTPRGRRGSGVPGSDPGTRSQDPNGDAARPRHPDPSFGSAEARREPKAEGGGSPRH